MKNELSGNRLKEVIKEVWGASKSSVITEAMSSELAHRLVHGSIEERCQGKRLTGEWIIFAKEDGNNYYLCLARHTDGDEAIFAKLKRLVFPEFVFLQDKYG